MHSEEVPLSPSSGNDPAQYTASFRACQKTSSWKLLNEAVSVFGSEKLADELGIEPADVERLIEADRPMTYAQQRALAIAVLVLSDGRGVLRRRAASLLAQVHAAEDFAAGITERHGYPPPSHHWK